MLPEQASQILRRIAAKIDASQQPSTSLVRRDLQLLASVLVRRQRIERLAREMLQIAADDVEVSIWDTDEGKDVEEAMKFTRRQEEPKKLEFALKGLKSDVDEFLTELKREPGSKKPGAPPDEDVVTSAPPRR